MIITILNNIHLPTNNHPFYKWNYSIIFDFIKILFYLQFEILHHGYLGLTTALYKRCPYMSARPLHNLDTVYHYITSDFLRDSCSNGPLHNFPQMSCGPH